MHSSSHSVDAPGLTATQDGLNSRRRFLISTLEGIKMEGIKESESSWLLELNLPWKGFKMPQPLWTLAEFLVKAVVDGD